MDPKYSIFCHTFVCGDRPHGSHLCCKVHSGTHQNLNLAVKKRTKKSKPKRIELVDGASLHWPSTSLATMVPSAFHNGPVIPVVLFERCNSICAYMQTWHGVIAVKWAMGHGRNMARCAYEFVNDLIFPCARQITNRTRVQISKSST